MADSAAQFQPGTIMSGYNYTPVKGGDLGGSHLFGGAGQLWAQVGQTALDASKQLSQQAQMLQQSPVNPAVKAKQDYDVADAKQGQSAIDYLNTLSPDKRALLMREGPQGHEALAPAESQAVAPLFQPTDPTKKNGDPPPAPAHAPGTGKEPLRKEETPAPTTQPTNKPALDINNPPEDSSDLSLNTVVPSQGGSTASLSAGGSGILNTGQGQDPEIEAVPAAQLRAQQQQPSSIYSPGRPTPLAPPAPGPAQPPAQPPAEAKAQQDAQMQQWQQQSMGLPLTADDAMAWMGQRTTLASGATFMPHGGPQGEPAYAFHMKTPGGKGGGTNIVPVSQMVQNGAGPAVAAQNTSMVLSASDRIKQQQQNSLAAPPDAPLGQQPPDQPPGQQAPDPSQQPSPVYNPLQPSPGVPAPVGGPPAAPVPSTPLDAAQQPVTDNQGNPLSAYTNVPSKGGLDPHFLSAGGDTPPPVAQPTVKPEITPLSDQDKIDLNPSSIATARQNAAVQSDQPANEGDPNMGKLGPWNLYRDDGNQTGELYAARPGLTSLFKQQRYVLGSSGWQEYDLPTTNMRLNMEAEFGGGKGGASGGPTKGGGTFPTMSFDQIAAMPVPAMKKWLNMAAQYHNTNGTQNDAMESRLTGLADIGQRMQRLMDGNTAAMNGGIPSNNYGREAQNRSHAAAERDKINPPSDGGTNPSFAYGPDAINKGWRNYWNAQARGQPVDKMSDYLEEQVKRINDQEGQLPGRQPALQNQKANTGPSATVVGPWGMGVKLQGGDSDVSSVSPHRSINALFESGDQKAIHAGLAQQKAEFDREFQESYTDAVSHNYRVTPAMVAYHNHLTKGAAAGAFHDEQNSFRDKNGHVVNTFTKSAVPGATPTPSPSPTAAPTATPSQRGRLSITSQPPVTVIKGDDDPALKNLKSGDVYQGPDGVKRYWP